MVEDFERWFVDHGNVVAFGRALVNADYFDDKAHVLFYFSEPYKHTTDYKAWRAMGSPLSRDYEKWDDFFSFIHGGDVSEETREKLKEELDLESLKRLKERGVIENIYEAKEEVARKKLEEV